MFVQAKCTNCGGALAVDNEKDAWLCPYCNTPFVVEKAINNFNITNNIKAETVNVYGNAQSDFVIERSVLVKYNGYKNREVVIPNGITEIGKEAFSGMSNIESVKFPESLITIGEKAFHNCTGIHKLSFPDNVRVIRDHAFKDCTSLESVHLSKNLICIGWEAFAECSSLKTIEFQNSLKYLCPYAFMDCVALTNICLPQIVEKIDAGAFSGCTALTSITLPPSLLLIEEGTFRGCTALKSITIPPSVDRIGVNAFFGCTALEKVTIQGHTHLIEEKRCGIDWYFTPVFGECPNLLDVQFADFPKYACSFPAFIDAHGPEYLKKGLCYYCGGNMKGILERRCTVCGRMKVRI